MIAVAFTSHRLCAAPQTDETALSLPVSPALYAHDTSSSFVICLSLPSHTSSLTASRLSFICKYLWGKEGEEMLFSFWKTNSLTNLVGVPLLHLIGHGLQRDSGLLSPIMGWGLTETVSAQWWLMGRGNKVDSVRMELCREGYKGGGAGQNKPKLQLHSSGLSGLLADGKRMLRVLFTQFPYIWIKISLWSPQGCCRLI